MHVGIPNMPACLYGRGYKGFCVFVCVRVRVTEGKCSVWTLPAKKAWAGAPRGLWAPLKDITLSPTPALRNCCNHISRSQLIHLYIQMSVKDHISVCIKAMETYLMTWRYALAATLKQTESLNASICPASNNDQCMFFLNNQKKNSHAIVPLMPLNPVLLTSFFRTSRIGSVVVWVWGDSLKLHLLSMAPGRDWDNWCSINSLSICP